MIQLQRITFMQKVDLLDIQVLKDGREAQEQLVLKELKVIKDPLEELDLLDVLDLLDLQEHRS
jgi:hypothetical protein